MKKKIIIGVFTIFVILLILITYRVKSASFDDPNTMRYWAKLSYDEISQYSNSELEARTWGYDRTDEEYRAGKVLPQLACLEKAQGSGQGYPKNLDRIIDVSSSDGTTEAKIAFICWAAEKAIYGETSAYGMAIQRALNEAYGYNYTNPARTDSAIWEAATYFATNGEWPDRAKYESRDYWPVDSSKLPRGEFITSIVGKVLVFTGTGTQDCALLYGKASEDKVKIDKYIVQLEDSSGSRGPEKLGGDRSNKSDDEKKSNAEPVNEQDTVITYKIVITNEGESEIKVKYKDEFDSEIFDCVSGPTEETYALAKKGESGDKQEIELQLRYKSENTSGKYENKASIYTEDDEIIDHSSDWIEIGFKPSFSIDKYVSYGHSEYGEYNMAQAGEPEELLIQPEEDYYPTDRENRTDEWKEENAVEIGYDFVKHTVQYTVVITNTGKVDFTGYLYDTCQLGSVHCIDDPSHSNPITVPVGESVVCTLEIADFQRDGGKYKNTARFKVGSEIKESSDWVIISSPFYWNATLEKEVIEVSTPGDVDAVNRTYSGRGGTDKDNDPAEIVSGSIVTFRITATNYTMYKNTSDKDPHNDDALDPRVNEHYADMTFYDQFGGEWEFVECSADYTETEEGLKFHFEHVAYGESAIVELKLKALVDNMYLPNLYNYTTGVEFEAQSEHYTFRHDLYPVDWDPVYGEDGTTVTGYTPVYECPDSCGFDPTPSVIEHGYGKIEISDYDCCRVLDPVVGGVVFWDKDKDGYKGTDEEIYKMDNGETDSNYYMNFDDYEDITVELWDSATDSIVAGPLPIHIDTSTDDEKSGTFSFGRVRKGTSYTGSQTTQGYERWEIGEYNHFQYTGESRAYYYVVFNYNGLKFEATIDSADSHLNPGDHSMQSEFPIDSNAHELNRDDFNKKFETIANDKAYAGKTSAAPRVELEYTEKGRNLQKSFLSGSNPDLMIKAKSFQIFYDSGDIEYLKHINLGIFLRPQGDMSATKDVVQAEVTVNGYQTIYTYEQLAEDNANFAAEVNNTLSAPYKLKIYREDYEFRTEKYGTDLAAIQEANNPFTSFGRTNDLEIILTYKITVKNESGNADAFLREVMDYSIDQEMEFLEARLDTVDGPLLNASTTSSFENVSHAASGYATTYITGSGLDRRLVEGDTISLFVFYKLKKDGSGYIYKDPVGDAGKENVAEIGAFSLYKPGTEDPAGMVDGDSNPGNANPTDEPDCGELTVTDHVKEGTNTYFEDDTFKTTVLVIIRDEDEEEDKEKSDYRNISGIVWEEVDKDINNMGGSSDGEKVGNGKKDGAGTKTDIPAKNVIVKLFEVIHDSSEDKDYYVDTGMWYRTGEDGRYYFGDKTTESGGKFTGVGNADEESLDDCYRFHAGNYFVRFIYGDEADKLENIDMTDPANLEMNAETLRYSGQDYKSTIYTDPGTEGDETELLEATKFAEKSGDSTTGFSTEVGGTIYSFAKDNEIRRLEVNSYSTTMTYPMDNVLKTEKPEEGADKYERKLKQFEEETKLLSAHTGMYADTKLFRVLVEYYDNYDDVDTFTIDAIDNDGRLKTIEYYYHSIRDINFGLTERPLTKLQLMNDISEVRAITSDGRTLVDIFFDVVYQEPDASSNGEIIHKSIPNYKKSIGWQEVQILNRFDNNQGFRYVNIDSDLLQGMTITVKFQIAIANIGDIDHLAGWLEDEIENKNYVELEVDYQQASYSTGISVDHAGKTITDTIDIRGTAYDVPGELAQIRKYIYTENYLFDKVEEIESAMPVTKTSEGVEPDGEYKYNKDCTRADGEAIDNIGLDIGSGRVRTNYGFRQIQDYLGGTTYSPGYFVGETYFKGITNANEKRVQTRVDQYIDYVDNDLIFKPEENIVHYGGEMKNTPENLARNDQLDYLTYSTEEISTKGLLRDIVKLWNGTEAKAVESITDGQKDYYNSNNPDRNNLAFNIEKDAIETTSGTKIGLCKFLKPIENSAYETISDIEHAVYLPENFTTVDSSGNPYYDFDKNNSSGNYSISSIGNPFNKYASTVVTDQDYEEEVNKYTERINQYLYVIDLQASKTLTSELDLQGMVIDNLAEIVKATNTVGRKLYVTSTSTSTGAASTMDKTGHIGNTTKTPIESVNVLGSGTSLVTIAKAEIDTDFTEFVTFSPPTGLSLSGAVARNTEEKLEYALLIGIPSIVIVVGLTYVIVQFIKRKKFYK